MSKKPFFFFLFFVFFFAKKLHLFCFTTCFALQHDVVIPPAYEVYHGGIMFSSFLCVCVCVHVCLSVSNFRVCSITLKPLDIFS